MANLVKRESAQVKSSVQDLSQIDPRPEFAFFGCITASQGPLNEAVMVNTVEGLEQVFGKASKKHIGLAAAAKIIEGNFPGYLVRVASDTLESASVLIPKDDDSDDKVVRLFFKNKGTVGNDYSVNISREELLSIEVKRGDLVIETILVSEEEEDGEGNPLDNFILDLDHDLIGIELAEGVEEYTPIKEGLYSLSGGDDGVTSIKPEDYIGVEENGQFTGAQVFRQKIYKAQLFPSLGYHNKEFLGAMKAIADARKDLTCIYDTPTGLSRKSVEEWVKNEGDYEEDEYGITGWNCEVYWDWQKDMVNGELVILPPSAYVTLNSLRVFRDVGPWYPVAGDTRGVINSVAVVTQLPNQLDRDSLVTHSINPIYDTGTRGIQIYGNETLNPDFSDLSAAHIARTLTHIRSTVDEYTETKKFELNDSILWAEWVDYVQDKILAPIKASRGLQWYRATMGAELTSPEELSQRKVRGRVELQFTPDAEVFLLEYVVYASSEEME